MADPDQIRFVMTCMACPEQYDAYLADRLVGYIRLRLGVFRVEAPPGQTIHRHVFSDMLKGMFDSDEERDQFLAIAAAKIAATL